MWRNRSVATFGDTLPCFGPSLVAHDVLEAAVSIEDIKVIFQASAVARSAVGPPFAGALSAAHAHVGEVPSPFHVAARAVVCRGSRVVVVGRGIHASKDVGGAHAAAVEAHESEVRGRIKGGRAVRKATVHGCAGFSPGKLLLGSPSVQGELVLDGAGLERDGQCPSSVAIVGHGVARPAPSVVSAVHEHPSECAFVLGHVHLECDVNRGGGRRAISRAFCEAVLQSCRGRQRCQVAVIVVGCIGAGFSSQVFLGVPVARMGGAVQEHPVA